MIFVKPVTILDCKIDFIPELVKHCLESWHRRTEALSGVLVIATGKFKTEIKKPLRV